MGADKKRGLKLQSKENTRTLKLERDIGQNKENIKPPGAILTTNVDGKIRVDFDRKTRSSASTTKETMEKLSLHPVSKINNDQFLL